MPCARAPVADIATRSRLRANLRMGVLYLGETGWAGILFTVIACSAPSPQRQLVPPPPPPPADASVVADAALQAPPPSARGDKCTPDSCAEGLVCAPLPGGYCASFCGVTGTPCDGACVETGRGGEVCAKRCASDDDCRKAEGYVC